MNAYGTDGYRGMTEGAAEPTVLVVDDEPGMADMYADFLGESYDVRTTYDGHEAIDALDDSIDIVLLDRRMPEVSGDDVLRTIRDRDLPCRVVMTTAVQPDFDIIELGFDAYVVKPIDREDLVDAVEQTLDRAAFEEHLQQYFALTEKRTVLEASKPERELSASEDYAALTERIERARDRLGDHLEDFGDEALSSAIERTRGASAVWKREQRYRSLTEDVLDTSRVGTAIVDADRRVVWVNAAFERYLGLDREEIVESDYRTVVRTHLASRFDRSDEVERRLLDALEPTAGVEEFEGRLVEGGPAPAVRWLRHWSKPIEAGLYAGGRIEHYYDITAVKDREQTLEALHEATRTLMDAGTKAETATRSVDAASAVLGFPVAALYLWDEVEGILRPNAWTDAVSEEDLTTVSNGSNPVWTTFVTGELTVAQGGAGAWAADDLLLALGDHGVLALGAPDGGFTEADRSFAGILAANTEVALDRADRERALRERDEQLEQRNEQLERVSRIDTIIRSIGNALVSASSREAIEQTVCDRLVDVDGYAFVWIGEPRLTDEGLSPRAWAGAEMGFLDTLVGSSQAGRSTPADDVVRSRTPVTVGNILDDPAFESVRAEALNRGYRSVVSVPIGYERTDYGVLEVYADRPHAFDNEERDVIAELGDFIGHAINAVKRKEALISDTGIELEFELGGSEGFFAEIADTEAGEITLRSVTPGDDETYTVFFSVRGTPVDRVLGFAAERPAVLDATLVRERAEDALFKFRLGRPTVVTTIAELGGIPRGVRVAEGSCRVTFDLPGTTDVRSAVDAFVATYPDASLIAKRERDPAAGEPAGFGESFDASLTDRQREALRTAFFGGYFEWPRENDGQAIAETMDISQPTLLQHLRAGEQKLLSALFDGRD